MPRTYQTNSLLGTKDAAKLRTPAIVFASALVLAVTALVLVQTRAPAPVEPEPYLVYELPAKTAFAAPPGLRQTAE